jgi:hypothetical protein
MRKIISLGLFALMISMFSSQVFAGKVDVCEDEKAELKSAGLYGLCNAYWNATNENARERILANFEKKAGPNGPGMPGLESCPCWDVAELVNAACNHNVTISTAVAVRFDNDFIVFANFPGMCGYTNHYDGFSTIRPTSFEEASMCASGMSMLLDGSFLSDCED